MAKFKLNIDIYIDKEENSLVGRENGINVYATIHKKGIILADIEKEYDVIEVSIPPRIVTMNKSFFLGLFSERVQFLGFNGFKSKYYFNARPYILKRIDSEYIAAALLTGSPSDIFK